MRAPRSTTRTRRPSLAPPPRRPGCCPARSSSRPRCGRPRRSCPTPCRRARGPGRRSRRAGADLGRDRIRSDARPPRPATARVRGGPGHAARRSGWLRPAWRSRPSPPSRTTRSLPRGRRATARPRPAPRSRDRAPRSRRWPRSGHGGRVGSRPSPGHRAAVPTARAGTAAARRRSSFSSSVSLGLNFRASASRRTMAMWFARQVSAMPGKGRAWE